MKFQNITNLPAVIFLKAKPSQNTKHRYEECLIQYLFSFVGKPHISTCLRSYCTICGKIGDKFKVSNSIVKDYRRTVDTPIGNTILISRVRNYMKGIMTRCQYFL